MWYHFAFVAISVAMFGMTVGALVVYLKPAWFPADGVRRQLAVGSVLFPVLVVASFLTQLSIPFRVHPSIVAIWAIVLTYAVIAAPFVLSGILVALTLTRFPRDVGRLYAFDLVGAALGCVLLVWLLEITDGPTAVLAIAALAAMGGVCYALDEGSTRLVRWSTVVGVALIVAAAGHTVLVWRGFPVLRILYVKAGFEARPLYERWNSYSRDPRQRQPRRARGALRLGPEPELSGRSQGQAAAPRHRRRRRHGADQEARDAGRFRASRVRRHQHRLLPAAQGQRARRRRRRRPRRPVGTALRRHQGHRRRDQHQHPRHPERPLRRLHRPPRSRSAGALRQRRGAQLHRPRTTSASTSSRSR